MKKRNFLLMLFLISFFFGFGQPFLNVKFSFPYKNSDSCNYFLYLHTVRYIGSGGPYTYLQIPQRNNDCYTQIDHLPGVLAIGEDHKDFKIYVDFDVILKQSMNKVSENAVFFDFSNYATRKQCKMVVIDKKNVEMCAEVDVCEQINPSLVLMNGDLLPNRNSLPYNLDFSFKIKTSTHVYTNVTDRKCEIEIVDYANNILSTYEVEDSQLTDFIVNFKDFSNVNALFDKDLYFRIKTTYELYDFFDNVSYLVNYSDIKDGPFVFTKRIQGIKSVNCDRPSCGIDTIYATFGSQAEVDELLKTNCIFQFLVPGNQIFELKSNLVRLNSRNPLKFVLKDDKEAGIRKLPQENLSFKIRKTASDGIEMYESQSYTMQPTNSSVELKNEIISKYSCTQNEEDSTYNTQKNNVSDAYFEFEIYNSAEDGINPTTTYIFKDIVISENNSPYYIVPAEKIEEIGDIVLGGKSYPGKFKISNLSPNIDYRIAVRNTLDGCPSMTPYTVNFKDPDPLVIDSIKVMPVSCDKNVNSKSNSQYLNNGSIHVFWSGGIGPYFIECQFPDSKIEKDDSICENNVVYDYNRSAVPAGNYRLHISDRWGRNEVFVDTLLMLNSNPPFFVENVMSPVTCSENNDGELKFNVQNYNSDDISFKLLKESSIIPLSTDIDNVVTGLKEGRYYIESKNENSCMFYDTIIINTIDKAIMNVVASPVLENGGEDGKLRVEVSKGTLPYKVVVSDNIDYIDTVYSRNIAEIENLRAGEYFVKIIDSNACVSNILSVNIVQPKKPLLLSVDSVNISCYGGNDGKIILHARGGWDGEYTYGIEGIYEGGDSIITGLSFDQMPLRVYVIDSMGVEFSKLVNLTQPDQIAIKDLKISPLKCNNDFSGKLSFEITGGVFPYEYSTDNIRWDTNHAWEGLNANEDFKVYVKDDNSCLKTFSFKIPEPLPLSIDNIDVFDLSCFGDNSGSVSFNISGGTFPYYISHDTMKIRSTIMNSLSAGEDLMFIISDTNNCEIDTSLSISEPEKLTAELFVSHLKCYDDTSGVIKNIVHGGVGPYSCLLNGDNVIDGASSTGLSAGEYLFVVEDKNKCSFSSKTFLTQPLKLIGEVLEKTDNLCFSDSSGKVLVNAACGTPPYLYSIDSLLWNSSGYFDNLTAGSRDVYIKDENQCLSVCRIQLNEPDKIEFFVDSVQNLKCYNDSSGRVFVHSEGGVGSYHYSLDVKNWVENGLFKKLNANENLMLYTKDKNNCIDSLSVLVSQPEPIKIVPEFISAHCGKNDGEIGVIVTGGTIGKDGYNIIWTNHLRDEIGYGQKIDSLYSDSYIIEIIDGNLCEYREILALSNIDGPKIVSISVDSVSCFGKSDGTIKIDSIYGGTGRIKTKFDNKEFNGVLSNLSSQKSFLTITDSVGCSDMKIVEIPQPQELSLSFKIVKPACVNESTGAISVNVTGGTPDYSYLWNKSISTKSIQGIPAGWYTISVEDTHDCKISDSVFLENNPVLKLTSRIENVSCFYKNDGEILVTPEGGNGNYSCFWHKINLSTRRISNLEAGEYICTLFDGENCFITDTFHVSAPDTIYTKSIIQNPSCWGAKDGKAAIKVNGGVTPYYCKWYNGNLAFNLSELSNGEYKYTVYDSLNCSVTDSVHLNSPEKIEVSTILNNPLCFDSKDGNIKLDVHGGTGEYYYSWDNGSLKDSIGSISSGKYKVTVIDDNNCVCKKTFSLMAPDKLKIDVVLHAETCQGFSDGEIIAFPSGGKPPYRFLWNTNDTTTVVSGLTAGKYYLNIRDSNNCSTLQDFTIPTPDIPITNWLAHEAVICKNNFYNIDAGEFVTYNWFLNDTLIGTERFMDLDRSGKYVFYGENEKGCSILDSFRLSVWDQPLEATMLLPDTARVGESVIAIDVTWPVPDRIDWSFSNAIVSIDENLWSKEFTSDSICAIDVCLKAWLGSCFSSQVQKIVFIDSAEYFKNSRDTVNDLILEFKIYPNPNYGDFFVEARYSNSCISELYLVNLFNNNIVYSNSFETSKYLKTEVKIQDLISGVYLVVLKIDDQISIIKSVVK